MNVTQRPDLKIQQVDGETLVLDEENGYIHQLNESATFVWTQCDGKSSVDEITRRFAQEFDLDDLVASKDVAQVIDQLRELNLLCE